MFLVWRKWFQRNVWRWWKCCGLVTIFFFSVFDVAINSQNEISIFFSFRVRKQKRIQEAGGVTTIYEQQFAEEERKQVSIILPLRNCFLHRISMDAIRLTHLLMRTYLFLETRFDQGCKKVEDELLSWNIKCGRSWVGREVGQDKAYFFNKIVFSPQIFVNCLAERGVVDLRFVLFAQKSSSVKNKYGVWNQGSKISKHLLQQNGFGPLKILPFFRHFYFFGCQLWKKNCFFLWGRNIFFGMHTIFSNITSKSRTFEKKPPWWSIHNAFVFLLKAWASLWTTQKFCFIDVH